MVSGLYMYNGEDNCLCDADGKLIIYWVVTYYAFFWHERRDRLDVPSYGCYIALLPQDLVSIDVNSTGSSPSQEYIYVLHQNPLHSDA